MENPSSSLRRGDTKNTVPKSDTHDSVPESDTHDPVPKSNTHDPVPKSDTQNPAPKSDTHDPVPESERAELLSGLEQYAHPLLDLTGRGYRVNTEAEGAPAGLVSSPARKARAPLRQAVVLDCNMAQTQDGRQVVVSVSAADLLTGEVLVDALVRPTERVAVWLTRLHGISPRRLWGAAAAAGPQRILGGGAAAARRALWRHADRDTLLVGHALHNALRALGLNHTRVVDTAVVTAEAVFGRGNPLRRVWGLAPLSARLVGRPIRLASGLRNSREDVLAVRRLALWCLRNPKELEEWAADAKKKYYGEEEGLL